MAKCKSKISLTTLHSFQQSPVYILSHVVDLQHGVATSQYDVVHAFSPLRTQMPLLSNHVALDLNATSLTPNIWFAFLPFASNYSASYTSHVVLDPARRRRLQHDVALSNNSLLSPHFPILKINHHYRWLMSILYSQFIFSKHSILVPLILSRCIPIFKTDIAFNHSGRSNSLAPL